MQDVPHRETTDLVVMKPLTAEMVYVPGGVDAILKKIADEVRAHKADISTEAGRAAIASLAYKVARSKTALDDMGQDLVRDWKAKAAVVDAERRKIRAGLDALKEEVRKPLTDWENADKQRIQAHEQALVDLESLLVFTALEPTAAEVAERKTTFANRPLRNWEEFTTRAQDMTARVGEYLERLHKHATKREAEAAELARLRAEAEERARKERDERIAAEAAERARLEAEAKARREAEQAALKAKQEQERLQREKDAERERAERAEIAAKEAAEKAERDRIAAAEQAERDREAAVEAERKRVAEAEARDKAAAADREANKKHRAKINNEILASFVQAGLEETAAKTIIGLIASGSCPHVKILY